MERLEMENRREHDANYLTIIDKLANMSKDLAEVKTDVAVLKAQREGDIKLNFVDLKIIFRISSNV